jgi:hypothetical protein
MLMDDQIFDDGYEPRTVIRNHDAALDEAREADRRTTPDEHEAAREQAEKTFFQNELAAQVFNPSAGLLTVEDEAQQQEIREAAAKQHAQATAQTEKQAAEQSPAGTPGQPHDPAADMPASKTAGAESSQSNTEQATKAEKPNELETAVAKFKMNNARQQRLVILGDPDIERRFLNKLAERGDLYYSGGSAVITISRKKALKLLHEVANSQPDTKAVHALSMELEREGGGIARSVKAGVANLLHRYNEVDVVVVGKPDVRQEKLKELGSFVEHLESRNYVEKGAATIKDGGLVVPKDGPVNLKPTSKLNVVVSDMQNKVQASQREKNAEAQDIREYRDLKTLKELNEAKAKDAPESSAAKPGEVNKHARELAERLDLGFQDPDLLRGKSKGQVESESILTQLHALRDPTVRELQTLPDAERQRAIVQLAALVAKVDDKQYDQKGVKADDQPSAKLDNRAHADSTTIREKMDAFVGMEAKRDPNFAANAEPILKQMVERNILTEKQAEAITNRVAAVTAAVKEEAKREEAAADAAGKNATAPADAPKAAASQATGQASGQETAQEVSQATNGGSAAAASESAGKGESTTTEATDVASAQPPAHGTTESRTGAHTESTSEQTSASEVATTVVSGQETTEAKNSGLTATASESAGKGESSTTEATDVASAQPPAHGTTESRTGAHTESTTEQKSASELATTVASGQETTEAKNGGSTATASESAGKGESTTTEATDVASAQPPAHGTTESRTGAHTESTTEQKSASEVATTVASGQETTEAKNGGSTATASESAGKGESKPTEATDVASAQTPAHGTTESRVGAHAKSTSEQTSASVASTEGKAQGADNSSALAAPASSGAQADSSTQAGVAQAASVEPKAASAAQADSTASSTASTTRETAAEVKSVEAEKPQPLRERIATLAREGSHRMTAEQAHSLVAELDGIRSKPLSALDAGSRNKPSQTLANVETLLKRMESGKLGPELQAQAKDLAEPFQKWVQQDDARREAAGLNARPDAVAPATQAVPSATQAAQEVAPPRAQEAAPQAAPVAQQAAAQPAVVQPPERTAGPAAPAAAPASKGITPDEIAQLRDGSRFAETEMAGARLSTMMANPPGSFTNRDKSWNEDAIQQAATSVLRLDPDSVSKMSPNQQAALANYSAWVADKAESGKLPGFSSEAGKATAHQLVERAATLLKQVDGASPSPAVAKTLAKADAMVSSREQLDAQASHSSNAAISKSAVSGIANDMVTAVYRQNEVKEAQVKFMLRNASSLTPEAVQSLDPQSRAKTAVALEHIAQSVRGGSMGPFSQLPSSVQKNVVSAQQTADKLLATMNRDPAMRQELNQAYNELNGKSSGTTQNANAVEAKSASKSGENEANTNRSDGGQNTGKSGGRGHDR